MTIQGRRQAFPYTRFEGGIQVKKNESSRLFSQSRRACPGSRRIGGKRVARKATDFRDSDRTAWYAEAVSQPWITALLYGKSSDHHRPERRHDHVRRWRLSSTDLSDASKARYFPVYGRIGKSKWYYDDVALAVQMGTYNGAITSAIAPDAPHHRGKKP